MTSKLNRIYPLNIVNMYAKFEEDAQIGSAAIVFTRLILCKSKVTLASKINRIHPFTIVNMSAKFDEDAHNGCLYDSVQHVITIQVPSDLDLQPQ